MFFISIIIPIYNRSDLITRCIKSVIDQVYSKWEIVIVDDGSTDKCEQAIATFNDSRIRYVYQQNAGASVARNNGVNHAKGNYIIFLDSDDAAEPKWLDMLVKACDQNQDIVTCGFKRYNVQGNLVEEKNAESGHALQQRYGIFLAGTYLIKKCLFLDVGAFDISLKSGHHTDLSIRLIQLINDKKISTARINNTLVKIYDHSGEKIRSNWGSVYEGSRMILEKNYLFMKNSDLPWLQSYYTVLAHAANALKLRKDAIAYGWKAILTNPLTIKNWARLIRYFFT